MHRECPQYKLSATGNIKLENKWLEIEKNKNKYIIGGLYLEHERLPYRLPCTAGIWHTGLHRVPPVFTIPVYRYKQNSAQMSNSHVTGMFRSKQLGTGD
jgi:hypothetical protein